MDDNDREPTDSVEPDRGSAERRAIDELHRMTISPTRIPLTELAQTLQAWVAVSHWAASREFLLTHQMLWSEVAEFLLGHLFADAETEHELRAIETHQQLLHAMRMHGVDVAFAKYLYPAETVEEPVEAGNDGDDPAPLDAERRVQLSAHIVTMDALEQALSPATRLSILVDWANALQELAERISGSQARDFLRTASTRYDDALDACDRASHPVMWAMIQVNKGAALRTLGTLERGTQRYTTYVAAIACYDRALEACSVEIAPREWAGVQTNKGVALAALAEVVRGQERARCASAAIVCYDSVVAVRPAEFTIPEWAALYNNKGMALRILAETHADAPRRHLLQEAIACFDVALAAYAHDAASLDIAMAQTNRAATLDSLATLLAGEERRRMYNDAIASYDAALTIYSRAVAPRDWAMVQNDKGTTTQALASLLSGVEQQRLLRDALACFDAALLEYTREAVPLYWATVQNNKGEAQRQLAETLVDDEERAHVLALSLTCFDAALDEYERDLLPLQWAGAQNNKGAALCSLGALLGGREARQAYIDALTCYDAALLEYRREVAPFDWAMVHNNTGNALLELARMPLDAGERRRACDGAIAHYTAALEVRRLDSAPLSWAESNNNKGNALAELAHMVDRGARLQTLEAAVTCHQAAYDASAPLVVSQRHRTAAAALARARITLALERREGLLDELDQAWKATLSGLEATRRLERLAPARTFRETEWAESATLFSLAAAIQALRGNLADAIALVEAGRTRGLAEEYVRRHAQLDALSDDERREYEVAARDVLEIEAIGRQLPWEDLTRLVAEAQARDERLAQVIARLRIRLPEFMAEQLWSLESLTATLRQDEALVYLMPYSFGTLLLAVFPDRAPHAEWLYAMTTGRLFGLAAQPDADGYNRLGFLPAAVGRGVTSLADALDTLLPTLGEQVVAHVVSLVRGDAIRRAVLAPGGLFAVLPLHAATYAPLTAGDPATTPDGRRYACDDLTLTYTPSGRTLMQARALAKRLATPTRGLVVANPQLIPDDAEGWVPGAPGYLTFAEVEAHTVVAAMRAAGFDRDAIILKEGAQATREAVLEGLRSTDIAHLAMHASFDSGDPLSSGLRVAPGESLSMRDLMDGRLLTGVSLRLVTLSACQTGLGDFRRLREEAVGLYGAFLAVGAAGVIASMWPVHDASAAELMGAFMRTYLADGYDGGAALADAMRAIRASRNQAGDTTSPNDDALAIETEVRYLTSAVQPRPIPATHWFDHPSHWAAFGYFGA